MTQEFKEYCLGLIGVDASSVTIIDTLEPFTAPLAAFFFSQSSFSRLKNAIRGGDYVLDCFGLDLPTVDLATSLDIPVHGYDKLPSASVMALPTRCAAGRMYLRKTAWLQYDLRPNAFRFGLLGGRAIALTFPASIS